MEEYDEEERSIDEAEEEVEEPTIECLSEQEEHLDTDVLNADAEIDDLGKCRGTNDARDDMVKKLRTIPPNANTQ